MAKIIKKFYTLYKTEDDNNDYFWIKNEGTSNGKFYIEKYGGWDEPIECSYDKINWWSYKDYQYHDEWQAGEKIYLRNSSGTLNNINEKYARFINSLGNPISIGGDMTTLVNYQFSNKKEIYALPDYCFYNLFSNSKLLSIDCNIGNVETIGVYSFKGTFKSSNSLESVSFDMSKVKTIGNGGMNEMFYNCDNLTSINIDLSSLETVEYNGMRGMFSDCDNLTSINIDLSSLETVGSKGMQYMFSNCPSLTKGLDLKSVTNVGDYGMQLLYGSCYRLSEVTAPNISVWDTSKLNAWLNAAGIQVSGTKIVNCPTGLIIPTNTDSGIPSGWTRVDY